MSIYKIQWGRNTLMIAPSIEGERETYVGISPMGSLTDYTGVHLTPDQAAEAARALLGDDMVVVRREDAEIMAHVRFPGSNAVWVAARDRLKAALGPEPCPAYFWIDYSIDKEKVTCTLPRGHDGDHVAPKEAWTNG